MPSVRPLLAALLAATAFTSLPTVAAEPTAYHLSAETGKVQWKGAVTTPSPLGCESPNLGCDTRNLVVQAPKGTWITVRIDNAEDQLRVTHDGTTVGAAGPDLNPRTTGAGDNLDSQTVFQQIGKGAVRYAVTVGDGVGTPTNSTAYTLTAELAGHAWDRSVPCALANADGVTDTGTAKTRTLRVRLVGAPKDAATVRAAGRTLTDIYARIGVPVQVSYDFFVWHTIRGDNYPYEAVRRHYGGMRPPGVDVVDVINDEFSGGEASCIGGIQYPEKAFATSQLHYTVESANSPRPVPAALLAAHEIGHLLGAQHNQVNCVEAVPQELMDPAQDGYIGPCTVMGPLALQDSEMFSTLERNTIRSHVNAYANRASDRAPYSGK